jgi:hypothetical protein
MLDVLTIREVLVRVVDEAQLVSHKGRVDLLLSVQFEKIHVLLVLVYDLSPRALFNRYNLTRVLANYVVFLDVLTCVEAKAMHLRSTEQRLLWHTSLNADIRTPLKKHFLIVSIDGVQYLGSPTGTTKVCIAFSLKFDAKTGFLGAA